MAMVAVFNPDMFTTAAVALDAMDAPLVSMLTVANISERTVILLAKGRCLEKDVFLDVAGERELLRAWLIGVVKLDAPDDFVDISKLIGCWRTNNIVGDVVARVSAERTANHAAATARVRPRAGARGFREGRG